MSEAGTRTCAFPRGGRRTGFSGRAWTLIFVLIASSGIVAWEHAPDSRTRVWLLALFAVNAVVNVLWSGLFFKLRRPDWAMIDLVLLWLSIFALLVFVGRISPTAGVLMVPYLAWVTFAGALNWTIVRLNAPFGEAAQMRRDRV